mgnify:CR=1 FL=1
MRRINDAGLALIKEFEGLKLTSYRCPAGVWTIGWGSTGPHVVPGMTITEEEAETLLRDDLRRFEEGVEMLVEVPLNDNQFSALVSFAFNLGLGALSESTLLRLLNEGDYGSVPAQLLRWNKVGGKVLAGLTRRRKAEGELWGAT